MDNRNNPCNKTTFLLHYSCLNSGSKIICHTIDLTYFTYISYLLVVSEREEYTISICLFPISRRWAKHPFMKNEQKVPNGIEIYAVKPNISSIRCVFFGQTSPRGEFVLLIIYIASIPTIIFGAVRKDFNPSIFRICF